jgi:hypothetical protein
VLWSIQPWTPPSAATDRMDEIESLWPYRVELELLYVAMVEP